MRDLPVPDLVLPTKITDQPGAGHYYSAATMARELERLRKSRSADHIDMLMADVERLRAERDLHYTRLASLLFSGALDNVTGGQFRQWEKEYIDAKAERDALREFVAALFEAIDWPESGDLDGFTFQDLCEAHGILLPETRTEPCREGCWCDEYHGGAEGMAGGVICFRKPQWLIDATRALVNPPSASTDPVSAPSAPSPHPPPSPAP